VRDRWDLVVLGGGTAGLVGAHAAAMLGARVALVERDRTGGDCLWTGCVPSKTLLAAASRVAAVRRPPAFVTVGEAVVDFSAVMEEVRGAIRAIEPVDSVEALEDAGITVLRGQAEFDGVGSVVVDGERHAFANALLATGADPVAPDVPGLAQVEPLTSESVWQLDDLPGRLLVLGGGPVGCELGQAFARLGSRVTLVEAGARVLPHVDPDAAAVVHRALVSDGVEVLTGSTVERVEGAAVRVSTPAGRRDVAVDRVLVAVGRRARTAGIGLDRAGVTVSGLGAVVVDRFLRTTNPRVWAAGDVTPYPHQTHLAAYHAGVATANALLGLRRDAHRAPIPRVVFTDPEVAMVGAPTWAVGAAPAPRTVTRHHDHLDRAITDARTDGFSRLALERRGGRIIGATLVGPRAGESVNTVTLAIARRMSPAGLVGVVHAYPTYGDGAWNAAVDEVRARLASPAARRAAAVSLGVRRAWWGR
jgi:pyruvate/2-oxoglutarate dehydrogenase complex dihydrolipoamide dehydrogenase (E3) component